MYARSVLITGSSRGLGLELIRQFAPSVEILIATCRKPDEAEDLQDLAAKNSNIKIVALDVKAYDSFEKVAEQVSAIVGDKGLNVLINNAGVLPTGSRTTPFYTEEMAETYEVNTIAPTKLTKAFLPLLKQAGATNCEGDYYVKKSLVVNMSSILGSIESTSSSFYLPYNCTKAALNMVTKCLSCELQQYGISVISMHPGWVQTDMGTSAAPLTKDESMSLFVKTLGKITPEQTGQFFDWKGDKLPW